MKNKNNPKLKISNLLKRIIDIVISIAIITTLLPFIILTGLAILICEGHPIFYISQRVISATRTIKVRKFRTMVKDATSAKYKLNERFMRDGYLDIPLNCEVYTPIGRILERIQIVEIFQIINILKNEMSLIGNRPLPMNNIEILKKFPNWQDRFSSPCGITGITQIVGKFELLPYQRLELEVMYASLYLNKNTNILLCDLLIFWYTFRLLLTGKYLSHDKAIKLLLKCGSSKNA